MIILNDKLSQSYDLFWVASFSFMITVPDFSKRVTLRRKGLSKEFEIIPPSATNGV